jgi:hypothetical protein
LSNDNAGLEADDFINDRRQTFGVSLCGARQDFDGLSFNISLLGEALPEGIEVACDLGQGEHGNPHNPCRRTGHLLCKHRAAHEQQSDQER